MDSERPRVGIGVLVLRNDQLLLGKRKGAHGAGQYASPGGHLEHLETFAACAAREVFEETGCRIGPVRFLRVMNITQYAPRHYIDIAFAADWLSGEPAVREPDKIDGWGWYSLAQLPSPLFGTLPTAIAALVDGSRRLWDAP